MVELKRSASMRVPEGLMLKRGWACLLTHAIGGLCPGFTVAGV